MKFNASVFLILLCVVATIAGAQSAPPDQSLGRDAQVNGYWTDPSSGLRWAGKDNGKDVNWHQAMKYCQNLRLAGFSDWRIATIDELLGIYDKSAEAPGRDGQGTSTWHVKGNLYLTGMQWSSSQRMNDQGGPDGFAWYFDFMNGRRNDEDAGRFSGRLANYGKRALCVRGPVAK